MEQVTVKSCSFTIKNDVIRGDLYLPSKYALKVPAVVIAGPMTSVKEQVTGVYCRAIAKLGFAALTIDHRHYGESDGHPRQYEFYQHKIEDLIAAVEFLSVQSEVDSENIGLLGICLGCGYASWASIYTDKVKWLALVVGYYRDVEAMKADEPDAFQEKVKQGIQARLYFEQTGELITIPAAARQGDAAMSSDKLVDYYTNRANVPNYKNEFAVMSREHFVPFDVQTVATRIKVPTIVVHSENALSPLLARKLYENLKIEKHQLWLKGESQDDFYDNSDLVKESTLFIAKTHGAIEV